MKSKEITTTKFAIFKGTKVRKVIFQNEWWFSIELSTICRQLVEHIEFDVFNDSKRYYFNYGGFALIKNKEVFKQKTCLNRCTHPSIQVSL